MARLVNAHQDAHWENRRTYRDPRDTVARAFAVPKIDWICDALDIGRDASVLDVGAGNGMFTWWWRDRGARVRGVELSQKMIERSPCRQLLVRGSAYELPFDDGSFDVVFEANLLHHLEQPADALREMARVSRGAVAVCEPNRNHVPMAMFGAMSSVCRGLLAYSRHTLISLAAEADLAVVGATAHGYVYENRSPKLSLPVARRLERVSPGGAYVVLACRSAASNHDGDTHDA